MRIVVELSDADRAFLARLWAETIATWAGGARDVAAGEEADGSPLAPAEAAVSTGDEGPDPGAADARRASPQAGSEDVEASRPPPAPSGIAQPVRKWSAERVAIVREHWPTSLASIEILRRVNALPGPEVTRSQLQGYASVSLHLKRPEGTARKMPDVPPIGSPLRPNGQAQRPAPVTTGYVAQLEPAPADFETIYSWAGNHGIPSFDGSHQMLAAVNAKRLRVGLSPFRLVRRA